MSGEGSSSSSWVGTGDMADCAEVFEGTLPTLDVLEIPLAVDLMDATSLRSLLAPSKPPRADADALGLSEVFSSTEFFILLRMDDLIDLEVLSFVSEREKEG